MRTCLHKVQVVKVANVLTQQLCSVTSLLICDWTVQGETDDAVWSG